MDVLVDVVGANGLPALLSRVSSLPASGATGAEPSFARAGPLFVHTTNASAGASAGPAAAVASGGGDEFSAAELAACDGLGRSLVLSLWLLHVRDAASLWFSAAALGVTAPLGLAPGAGLPATSAGAAATAAIGAPDDGMVSPVATATPASAGGSSSGAAAGDAAADAVLRVRVRAGAEMARAASRLALLGATSHPVRWHGCSGAGAARRAGRGRSQSLCVMGVVCA